MKAPLIILLLGTWLLFYNVNPAYFYIGLVYVIISILWITTKLILNYKKIEIGNLFLGLVEQLPLKRAFRNFFITGNAWGLFSIRSHQREDGKLKVMYNTKETAKKAADSMAKKMDKHFSVYKCIYCNGYHLGKNRENK